MTTANKEPLILAIETATRAGSVGLARGENVIASSSGDPSSSHSIDLIENIDKLLHSVDAKLADVDLFGVAVGPGSFTGLRIGLATVKSFAVCTGRKCAGVSTLEAIAYAAGPSKCTVALLPAGRGEVFAQMFSVSEQGVRALDTAAHIDPQGLAEKYGQLSQVTWAGEGAHLLAEHLRAWAKANKIALRQAAPGSPGESRAWVLAAQCNRLAISVAALAFRDYCCGNVVGPEQLRANYVRPSDAEIKARWQHKKSNSLAPT